VAVTLLREHKARLPSMGGSSGSGY